MLILCGLALNKMGYAAGNATADGPCNVNLEPKDPTSKYIKALQCMNEQLAYLQSQVDALKTNVAETASDAASAQATASDARTAAERAAQYAQDTNSKLDRMFKKPTSK